MFNWTTLQPALGGIATCGERIRHLNRGNTQINRPQIFMANLVYYLPDLKDQHEIVQAIAGGWELGAITQYASGTSTTFSQNGISEDLTARSAMSQWPNCLVWQSA